MTSLMLAEAREAPDRIAAMLGQDQPAYAALAQALGRRPPRFAATIARGSSDHAATYAATLIGVLAGRATASLPPSLVTRYGASLDMQGALAIGLSQSGASPDIVRTLTAARDGGALTVAVVNAEQSKLAAAAEHVLPQRAGPEHSVAATKSFILTLAVCARLVAEWKQDAALLAALPLLPQRLQAALDADWTGLLPLLDGARGLYVVGRGAGLAPAQESALKLKETCGLHAEAVSAAEIQHGPRAVVDADFPVLLYGLDDPCGQDCRALAEELARIGVPVALAAETAGAGVHLKLPPPLHPMLDPIVAIGAFYVLAEQLARSRGQDPDRPRGLRKVTETL